MSDRRYWLGFSLVPEIGPKRIHQLLTYFDSLASAWEAPEAQLQQAGLEQHARANLLRVRKEINLDAQLARVEQAHARLLTLADTAYPPLLKTLDAPPLVLYVLGDLTPADERCLAVVGTRKATAYGRAAAHQLSKQIAAQGVTIISGLAHGIDSAAHIGALDGGGRTLAVLGTGIDRIYPRDQQELAQRIRQHGAILSEFPLGTPPEARNFPRRNRVISGLALGVLVVEAPENSGALITAAAAADQGREVFSVPGNIFNPASRGNNRLIQEGAKLVLDVQDILDEFNIAYSNVQTRVQTQRLAPDNPVEAEVLKCLSADPLHIDELARTLQMPVQMVSAILTILELKGLAQSAGNMQYSLTMD